MRLGNIEYSYYLTITWMLNFSGSAYGSQLQSPVSGDSPVGIDGSAMVLQQFGLDQLQVGEQFWVVIIFTFIDII